MALPWVKTVTNHGATKSSVLLKSGIAADLRVVSDKEYPYALHHFTGSKEHNVAMRQRATCTGKKAERMGPVRKRRTGKKSNPDDERPN